MAMAELEAGFAKLQGEDFEYYMQTYSIILGRNSKKSSVDVDLAGLGGGMNISRQHARIYYDFERKRFALEVLGKNGCSVEGVLYLPGNPPIKLDSQDLLQIGDKKFYFLLPMKSILKASASAPVPAFNTVLPPTSLTLPLPIPAPVAVPLPALAPPPLAVGQTKKRSSAKAAAAAGMASAGMKQDDVVQPPATKKGRKKQEPLEMGMDRKPSTWSSFDGGGLTIPGDHSRQAMIFHAEPRVDSKKRSESGSDVSPMQTEEKEVVSAVATVLSDLCGPGEWMPLPRLHSELVEHYSGIWPPSRVRRFLTAEDIDIDSKGRPWVSLLSLLRKYPEHFVINTKNKGKMTAEFISLVSLLS